MRESFAGDYLMYDHGKKAGNQGDVVKHVALVTVLDTLLSSGSGVFRYADAFAGYPLSLLAKGGEWSFGIGHLAKRRAESSNKHVGLWQKFWSTGLPLLGSTYPGSSNFALRLALSSHRSIKMFLWDIAPGPVAQLRAAYKGLDVIVSDKPADALSFPECDFLLVDPPGVGPKKGYPLLDELFQLAQVAPAFLLWLPMLADLRQKPPSESENSVRWREIGIAAGCHTTSVRWTPGGPVCGCQLLYVLPGRSIGSLRAAVDAVVDLTGWPLKEIEHRDP